MSSQMIELVDLLADKKGIQKEAHLVLFEYCNLSCSFCHQDHDSRVGLSSAEMWDKAETLMANTKPTDQYILNITGGELFLDEIPDEIFETYYQIAKRLFTYYDDVLIIFGANLIYTRVDRLENLIQRLEPLGRVRIATSYDPAGRFDRRSYELFMSNLNNLRAYVDTVNVVITKQNIERILTGKDTPDLTWLCDNFTVYFDHYIPSVSFETVQPTEDQIGELYLYLNEHHPNSHPLLSWKANEENITTCRSTKIITKDGIVTTCWSEAGKDAILDEGLGLIAKQQAEERFLEHYGCLACEYYSRCGLRCFLHHSFVESETQTCSIKSMFDVILAPN